MSYRNYGRGSYLPVRIHNGNVEIKFNTGIEKYSTGVKADTNWQIIEFYTEEVLFVIQHNGIRYIGRYDSTISGYDMKDNCIILQSRFELPPRPRLKQVGGIRTLIPCVAELDTVRGQIVYVPYTRDEFVFNKPYKEDVFIPTALADSFLEDRNHLYMYTSDGEEVDCNAIGQWFVQTPFTGICNTGIF